MSYITIRDSNDRSSDETQLLRINITPREFVASSGGFSDNVVWITVQCSFNIVRRRILTLSKVLWRRILMPFTSVFVLHRCTLLYHPIKFPHFSTVEIMHDVLLIPHSQVFQILLSSDHHSLFIDWISCYEL